MECIDAKLGHNLPAKGGRRGLERRGEEKKKRLLEFAFSQCKKVVDTVCVGCRKHYNAYKKQDFFVQNYYYYY